MPITKIPIVHKFGIISHSQRLELQERLLKQTYLSTLEDKQQGSGIRNPYDVTEDFVQQYNNAATIDEQEQLEATAKKMLERVKRRADLKGAGQGNHVDLPVAWTELAQLAQCKGKVQEDCLDVLITSLDQAPIERCHIPAMFYLGETCLYWLRTEAIHQPYLRTGELKLLRMGQLVFTRLFFHHMAGQLQGHAEFKTRLYTYLDGFSESQEAYSPYPNALLCLRYISEVGKMIVGDNNSESENKEGDNQTSASVKASDKASSVKASDKASETESTSLFHEVSANYEIGTSNESTHSGVISSSVHDLSPTLWHSLDVWRCVRQSGGGMNQALYALAQCAQGMATESWVDGVCALYILADAARASMATLNVLQGLAQGSKPSSMPARNQPVSTLPRNTDGTKTEEPSPGVNLASGSAFSSPQKGGPLSDIYEKSEEDSSPAAGQHGNSSIFTSPDRSHRGVTTTPGSRMSHQTTTSSKPATKPEVAAADPRTATEQAQMEDARAEVLHMKQPPTATPTPAAEVGGKKSATKQTTKQPAQDVASIDPVTARTAGEMVTDLGTGRASEASSVPTYTNAVHPESPGLHGWHWEVATTYADMLADVCLHGNTSNIQKVALVGRNKDVTNLHKRPAHVCPMQSAGLLDLVFFKSNHEEFNQGRNDWSWRVRYSAIQGLVKLCRCCAGDPNKEGLRTVAWNTLLRAHSMERDTRVLEALKVGQVDASIEKLLSQHLVVAPCSLGGKLAAGLASLYLPPLPPAVPHNPKKRPEGKKIQVTHSVARKPMRTSLKEEIQLATALYEPSATYNSRNTFDLHRVVEDQWRKDLHKDMEEEEEQWQKDLKEKQEKEEARQRMLDVQRRAKLGNKYKGPAYKIPGDSQSDDMSSMDERESIPSAQDSLHSTSLSNTCS